MMKTGRILARQAVERAILAIAMALMTARARRTHKAVRQGPGKRREQRMGRGQGRGKKRGR